MLIQTESIDDTTYYDVIRDSVATVTDVFLTKKGQPDINRRVKLLRKPV